MQVTASQRQVVMFELPLPPFHHEYGRIQRTLAHKYGVSLIPKRVFLTVLAASDSTLDTIHLSQAGHELMAARVWQLISSAFPSAVK
jgi:acyl-CoA thioesterase-1